MQNRAIDYFEKVLEINSRDIADLSNIANIAFNLKNYRKAKEYFEEALKHDPNSEYSKRGLKKVLKEMKKK